MLKAPIIPIMGCALFPTLPVHSGQLPSPPLMLASEYQDQVQLSEYLVSEKLDGVRAYWNGKHLLTRSGNLIQAPDWFTKGFPQIPLDGELWLGRGLFEDTSAVIRSSVADDQPWQQMKYMVFDLPAIMAPFEMRYQQLLSLNKQVSAPYLKVVEQFSIQTEQELMALLQSFSQFGAEGLMLRLKHGLYEAKRSHQLLKLKLWQDAEATVIAHQPGQGQFKGLLGALWVKDERGQSFKIGTGFDLEQRQNPPPIGSLISYRFRGRTNKGKPRFASFLRIHHKE